MNGTFNGIQTSGGWIRFVSLLNHDNVDHVGLDKLPRRRQFRMIRAIGECRAFANDDLSTATEASVDSELCIDLTVLRHPTLFILSTPLLVQPTSDLGSRQQHCRVLSRKDTQRKWSRAHAAPISFDNSGRHLPPPTRETFPVAGKIFSYVRS